MTEKTDAELRDALLAFRGSIFSDAQPIADAIRAIVKEEIEAAIAKRLAEYFK